MTRNNLCIISISLIFLTLLKTDLTSSELKRILVHLYFICYSLTRSLGLNSIQFQFCLWKTISFVHWFIAFPVDPSKKYSIVIQNWHRYAIIRSGVKSEKRNCNQSMRRFYSLWPAMVFCRDPTRDDWMRPSVYYRLISENKSVQYLFF